MCDHAISIQVCDGMNTTQVYDLEAQKDDDQYGDVVQVRKHRTNACFRAAWITKATWSHQRPSQSHGYRADTTRWDEPDFCNDGSYTCRGRKVIQRAQHCKIWVRYRLRLFTPAF